MRKLFLFLLLLPLSVLAQLPAGQDTTLRTPNSPVTPQFRYANYNGYRIPYIFNPSLSKYDALVTMKYANAWFAPYNPIGYLLRDGSNANQNINIGNYQLRADAGFQAGSLSITNDNIGGVFLKNTYGGTYSTYNFYTNTNKATYQIYNHHDYGAEYTWFDGLNGATPFMRLNTNALTINKPTRVDYGGFQNTELNGSTIYQAGTQFSLYTGNNGGTTLTNTTGPITLTGTSTRVTTDLYLIQDPGLATVGQVLLRDTTTGQAGRIRQLPLSYFAPATAINGTQNYIPKFTSANTVGNSRAIDDGTNAGIGGTPLAPWHVFGGESRLQGNSPFYSFYSQSTGLRIGYIQGLESGGGSIRSATNNSTGAFEWLLAAAQTMRLNSSGLQIGSIGGQMGFLELNPISKSVAAFNTQGRYFYAKAAILTDSTSAASATITNASVNAFGIPTIRATNTGVTYTNMGTLVIDGAPTPSTNISITNPYSIWVKAGNVRIQTYGAGIAHFDANGVISSSTIATADIANNAVTYGKIQALGAASRLMGTPSSGTTPQDITLGSNLSMSAAVLNVTGIPTATDYVTTNTTQTGLSGNKTWSSIHTFNNIAYHSVNAAATSFAGMGSASGIGAIANNVSNGGGELDLMVYKGSAGTTGGMRIYDVDAAGTKTLLADFNGSTKAFTSLGQIVPTIVNASASNNNNFAQYDQTTGAFVSRTKAQVQSDLGIVPSITSNTITTQTTPQTVLTYPVVGSDQVFNVSGFSTISSATGLTFNLNVSYTDENSTVTSYNILLGVIANGQYGGNAHTIKAKAGTNIVISTNFTGSCTYNSGAYVNPLF